MQKQGYAVLIPGAAICALPAPVDLPQIETFDVLTQVLAGRRQS
jgi:hypothetical protein